MSATEKKVTRRYFTVLVRKNAGFTVPEVSVKVVDVEHLDPRATPDTPWTDEESDGWLRSAADQASPFGSWRKVEAAASDWDKYNPKPFTGHIFVNSNGFTVSVWEIL